MLRGSASANRWRNSPPAPKPHEKPETLIVEEMTMREWHKARSITQVEMAKALGVNQEQIFRIEQRADLPLSTLKRSIEAIRGELILTAKFPDGAPIKLTGFAELDA